MPEDAAKAVADADADRAAKLDDSRIQWREATSERGAKFHIGTLKPADSDATPGESANLLGPIEAQKIAGSTRLFGVRDAVVHSIDVYWKVEDDTWKIPPQQVKDKVDITRFCVTKQHLSWWDYVVKITNAQDWDYTFYDESGDGYSLSCWVKGDHYVSYDSDKPTIVKVRAERG